MLDWFAKMLALPDYFCFDSQKGGGGVIQTTASESTLIAMLGARSRILQRNGFDNRMTDDEADVKYNLLSRLVAYTSSQSHASVEKAALLSATRVRPIRTRDDHSMDGEALRAQIEADKQKGLVPSIVIATLGTTNTCAFDDLVEIGRICNYRNELGRGSQRLTLRLLFTGEAEDIWLHVDAAYAGSAFVCPEFRHYMRGMEVIKQLTPDYNSLVIQYAASLTINPHKWLLVNFDCNAFWYSESLDWKNCDL